MTRPVAIATLIGAVLMLFAHTASAQRAEVKAWRLNGETRRAIVYPPSAKSAGGRAPLVFSFHGHGDNMQNFQHTDLHLAWPEAIVVYFQGLPSRRDGLAGWQVEKGQDDDRDLALVDAALDLAAREIQGRRGADLLDRVFQRRQLHLSAMGGAAGGVRRVRSGGRRLRPSVQPTQPKPLFHVAGTRDAQIPFADQQDAIEAARRADGVTGKGAALRWRLHAVRRPRWHSGHDLDSSRRPRVSGQHVGTDREVLSRASAPVTDRDRTP